MMISAKENTDSMFFSYDYDVAVCGGGPAGFCAAIAAARGGSKTILIERNGMLGGIWTAGLLSWILDCANKNGILREFIDTMRETGHGHFGRGQNFIAEPEWVKITLERMCEAAGVEILFYTTVVSAHVNAEKRLESIGCIGRGKQFDIRAGVFIDCTGDGDVGYLAGCSYVYGDGERAQPMTLIALADGLDPTAAREFDNSESYLKGRPGAKEKMFDYMEKLGIKPTYSSPSFFHVQDGLWIVMTVQEFGYAPDDVYALTRATREGREELVKQFEALKKSGGIFADLRLLMTAPYIGIRESRRILGEYTVTDEDILSGATFEDAVCDVTYNVDVHPTSKDRNFNEEQHGMRCKPYQIPLRALIAKEVTGLLLAGRCISGSFYAHSSYRVSGDASAMGEAAGRYAAELVRG